MFFFNLLNFKSFGFKFELNLKHLNLKSIKNKLKKCLQNHCIAFKKIKY